MSVLKIKDALGNWIKILTIKGDKGDTGNQGAQGIPGVSPTVAVTDIPGGHRVTITDADHPGGISFDVMDGSDADAPVQDVQINGVSILSNKIANMLPATTTRIGPIMVGPNASGLEGDSGNFLKVVGASGTMLQRGTDTRRAVMPSTQHQSVFYGLSKVAGVDLASETVTLGTYTDASKSAIHEMLSGSITVSGTTPTINALPGLRYICGECSTLTVNLPASGCVDIQFESGSTPTVLTVVPASGQTVKWANGFDPDTLEADTVYEINVADGLGVAGSWT